MNLLLEADPDELVVRKYLDKMDMYVGFVGDEPVAEIGIVKLNNEECELKNLATLKKHRGKRIC